MARRYRHAVTGREVTVADGSRMAALVEADANYVAIDGAAKGTGTLPKKAAKKAATRKKNS